MKGLNYKQLKRIVLVLIVLITYNTPVYSCSTPVYRYALEMWAAYAYRIEVVHNGNLSDEQQRALKELKASATSKTSANLKVIETIITESEDAEYTEPIIKLFFPNEHKIPEVVWEGGLTEENIKKIVYSPTRDRIFKNIQNGDAAVWVFLKSGHKEKDEKQLNILKDQLYFLSKNLRLSQSATDVSGNPLDINIINTGVTFSLVELDRNDPAEAIFIEILLRTEADLKLFKNVPLAFPVFGQGRTLYALVGNGINPKNIETACSAIIGWCSCTIKDDNPGTDLLLTADWNRAIGNVSWIKKEEVPEITGLYEFALDEDEIAVISESEVEEIIVEEIPAEGDDEPMIVEESEELTVEDKSIPSTKETTEIEQSSMSPLWRNSAIAFVLILVVITLFSFVLKKK